MFIKAEHSKKTGRTTREKRSSDDDSKEFNRSDDDPEDYNEEEDLEEFNLEGVIQDLEDGGKFVLADGLRSHLK